MSTGTHNVLRELEADLSYTPPRLRHAHIRRLDHLIPELQSDRLYVYEYIFSRITGFKPQSYGDVVLRGNLLQRELGRLLRKLSLAAPLDVTQEGEEVLLMPAVASQCRVGLPTLRRWSKRGLAVAYYRLPGGDHGWGVRKPALEQFLAERRARPVHEFKRMTEEVRHAVLERARELFADGISPTDIVSRLAAHTGYSASTVRRLLRHENVLVDENASAETCGLPVAAFEEMVRLFRAGTPAQELAARYGRSPATVYRALHRALVKRVLAAKINYIPNKAFAAPDAEAECLGAEGLFTYPPEPTPDMQSAPAGAPPYLAELYSIPLLSREREKELFRKYNYLRYRAAMLQEQIRHAGYRIGMIERFEELQAAAEQVRRVLIRCNLRLVVSIAKRHLGPLTGLQELFSEGSLCLIRTVECYDFSREARFSTYATWAISKHFARVVPEENYRMAAFVTGQQEKIDATGGVEVATSERLETVDHLRAILSQATGRLTERERAVIASHFGTDGRPARTLEEIGALLGLTRERIRQIEARALTKLRTLIGPEAIEGMA